MSTRLVARSVARPVRELLQPWSFNARVLATFAHVCNLVTAAGDVVALVDSTVGDGPLNVVVQATEPGMGTEMPAGIPDALANLKPGTPARLEGSILFVGDLEVALEKAVTWEPRPDWESLRARREAMISPVQQLRELALAQSPEESLLRLMQETATVEEEPAQSVQAAANAGAAVLRVGWSGDAACLREGVAWLAGLGGGLTPAGDDFLCGIMLAAWLTHPEPAAFCQSVLETAASRTTLLSAAFLRAAGRGECSAAWHRLLSSLAANDGREIAAAGWAVLSRGATSGADALAGFVTGCHYSLRA